MQQKFRCGTQSVFSNKVIEENFKLSISNDNSKFILIFSALLFLFSLSNLFLFYTDRELDDKNSTLHKKSKEKIIYQISEEKIKSDLTLIKPLYNLRIENNQNFHKNLTSKLFNFTNKINKTRNLVIESSQNSTTLDNEKLKKNKAFLVILAIFLIKIITIFFFFLNFLRHFNNLFRKSNNKQNLMNNNYYFDTNKNNKNNKLEKNYIEIKNNINLNYKSKIEENSESHNDINPKIQNIQENQIKKTDGFYIENLEKNFQAHEPHKKERYHNSRNALFSIISLFNSLDLTLQFFLFSYFIKFSYFSSIIECSIFFFYLPFIYSAFSIFYYNSDLNYKNILIANTINFIILESLEVMIWNNQLYNIIIYFFYFINLFYIKRNDYLKNLSFFKISENIDNIDIENEYSYESGILIIDLDQKSDEISNNTYNYLYENYIKYQNQNFPLEKNMFDLQEEIDDTYKTKKPKSQILTFNEISKNFEEKMKITKKRNSESQNKNELYKINENNEINNIGINENEFKTLKNDINNMVEVNLHLNNHSEKMENEKTEYYSKNFFEIKNVRFLQTLLEINEFNYNLSEETVQAYIDLCTKLMENKKRTNQSRQIAVNSHIGKNGFSDLNKIDININNQLNSKTIKKNNLLKIPSFPMHVKDKNIQIKEIKYSKTINIENKISLDKQIEKSINNGHFYDSSNMEFIEKNKNSSANLILDNLNNFKITNLNNEEKNLIKNNSEFINEFNDKTLYEYLKKFITHLCEEIKENKKAIFLGNIKKFQDDKKTTYSYLNIKINFSKNKKHLILIVNEITESAKITEQISELKYKNLLLKKICHEFKNPLLNILLITKNIRSSYKNLLKDPLTRSKSNCSEKNTSNNFNFLSLREKLDSKRISTKTLKSESILNQQKNQIITFDRTKKENFNRLNIFQTQLNEIKSNSEVSDKFYTKNQKLIENEINFSFNKKQLFNFNEDFANIKKIKYMCEYLILAISELESLKGSGNELNINFVNLENFYKEKLNYHKITNNQEKLSEEKVCDLNLIRSRKLINNKTHFTANLNKEKKVLFKQEKIDKQETNQGDIIDLAKLFKSLVNIFRTNINIIGKKITICYNIDNCILTKILFDKRKLKLIFYNLLSNAVKFTNNGKIEIKMEFKTETNKLFFYIIDSGIGMDFNIIGKIGKPYFKNFCNNNNFGIGMGIYIVKSLVKSLNGEFKIESIIKKGTTVILEFPYDFQTNQNFISQIEKSLFKKIRKFRSKSLSIMNPQKRDEKIKTKYRSSSNILDSNKIEKEYKIKDEGIKYKTYSDNKIICCPDLFNKNLETKKISDEIKLVKNKHKKLQINEERKKGETFNISRNSATNNENSNIPKIIKVKNINYDGKNDTHKINKTNRVLGSKYYLNLDTCIINSENSNDKIYKMFSDDDSPKNVRKNLSKKFKSAHLSIYYNNYNISKSKLKEEKGKGSGLDSEGKSLNESISKLNIYNYQNDNTYINKNSSLFSNTNSGISNLNNIEMQIQQSGESTIVMEESKINSHLIALKMEGVEKKLIQNLNSSLYHIECLDSEYKENLNTFNNIFDNWDLFSKVTDSRNKRYNNQANSSNMRSKFSNEDEINNDFLSENMRNLNNNFNEIEEEVIKLKEEGNTNRFLFQTDLKKKEFASKSLENIVIFKEVNNLNNQDILLKRSDINNFLTAPGIRKNIVNIRLSKEEYKNYNKEKSGRKEKSSNFSENQYKKFFQELPYIEYKLDDLSRTGKTLDIELDKLSSLQKLKKKNKNISISKRKYQYNNNLNKNYEKIKTKSIFKDFNQISNLFSEEEDEKFQINKKNLKSQSSSKIISEKELNFKNIKKDKKIIRIIIVEDEKFIRQSQINILKKILERKNILFEIEECEDGIECLYIIYKGIEYGIKYDFIITDETMNFLKGTFMAKILKKLINDNVVYDLKIFMITNHEEEIYRNLEGDIIEKVYAKPITINIVENMLSSTWIKSAYI